MIKAFLVLCLLAATGFFQSHAQNSKFHFSHFSVEKGLSQSSVSSILEDDQGFMWFGTQDGLNRFDAYSFQVFRNVSSDTNSISDNWIKALCQDQKGFIWVGTWLRGLNRYDPSTHKFTRYYHLRHTRIHSLYKDLQGNVWVASAEGLSRIYYNSQGKEQFQHYPMIFEEFLKNTSVLKIMVDRQGNCWLGTLSKGLIKIPAAALRSSFNTEGIIQYHADSLQSNGLAHNQVRCMAEDRKGNIWMGTARGLSRLNPQTGLFTNYFHEPANPNSLSEDDIWGLLCDSQNQLWIGTYSAGINSLNLATGQFTRYPTSLLSDFNRVEALYEDTKNDLWFGTLLGGVNYYDPNKYYFRHFQKGSEPGKGLNDNVIRSFFMDKHNVLWIGTQNGGLNKYDFRTGKFEYITLEDGLPDPYIKGIYVDAQGTVWLGTRKSGVVRIVMKNNRPRFTYFRHAPGAKSGLDSDCIANLWADNEGHLWVCSYEGGLNLFDPVTETFHSFPQTRVAASEYNEQNPVCAYDNNRGEIWIGGSSGLVIFNKKTSAVEFLKSGIFQSSILPVCNIKSIYEERPGITWLGTSKGLIRFNYADKKYKLYEYQQGLPSEMIYGILPDENRYLWLSTNKGLSRFHLDSATFRNYTTSDGLQHDEFNTGAFYRAFNGMLMFGGINGFNIFHPNEIKYNLHVPQVVLTDFFLHHYPVLPSASNPVLKKDISQLRHLVLQHEHKVISFEFTALNFSSPEKNQYTYMLENFDDKWTTADAAHRQATYTNLPPGEYIFRVKGSNNDGVWNSTGVALRITIKPPLWQTWWFRTGLVTFIVCMSFAFYRMRINQVKTHNRKLKRMIEERTAEIVMQKEELEQQQEEITAQRNYIEQRNMHLEQAHKIIQSQNEQLQQVNSELEHKVEQRTNEVSKAYLELLHVHEELDKFVYRAAHDLKGPILRMIGLCTVALMDITDTKSLDYVDRMSNCARDLDQILSRLLIADKIKQKNLISEPVCLRQMVEQVLYSLSNTEGFGDMKFDISIDESLYFPTDSFLLEVILQNMVKNSIDYRFPEAESRPRVEINISQDEQGLLIRIEDNGIDIPQEYAEKIFEMFIKANEQSKGSGLGLYVVRTAVERLQGRIRLARTGNHCNVFEVRIPFAHETMLKKEVQVGV